MDSICKKKYKSFEEFNEDSIHLVEYIKNNSDGMSETQKISYARKFFTKEVLNSCLKIGYLNENIIKL